MPRTKEIGCIGNGMKGVSVNVDLMAVFAIIRNAVMIINAVVNANN